jgi:hypothetical protein
MYDFSALRNEVFPHVQIKEIFPFLFQLGLWISFPKLRIKSLSSHLTPEQVRMVENVTRLDMELYEFARTHFDRHFFLYDSYDHFLRLNMHYLLLGLVLAVGGCCSTVWLCDRILAKCCRRCESRGPISTDRIEALTSIDVASLSGSASTTRAPMLQVV